MRCATPRESQPYFTASLRSFYSMGDEISALALRLTKSGEPNARQRRVLLLLQGDQSCAAPERRRRGHDEKYRARAQLAVDESALQFIARRQLW